VPPVAAGAEQQGAMVPLAVQDGGVVVPDQDHGAAVLGVKAHAPGQVMADGVGGEGQPPPAAATSIVVAATHPFPGVAADGLGGQSVVGGDVGVVDEGQVRDRVIGGGPVGDGAGGRTHVV